MQSPVSPGYWSTTRPFLTRLGCYLKATNVTLLGVHVDLIPGRLRSWQAGERVHAKLSYSRRALLRRRCSRALVSDGRTPPHSGEPHSGSIWFLSVVLTLNFRRQMCKVWKTTILANRVWIGWWTFLRPVILFDHFKKAMIHIPDVRMTSLFRYNTTICSFSLGRNDILTRLVAGRWSRLLTSN